jgi:hypothetical protein
MLGESSEAKHCRTQKVWRDDSFAPDGAKTPETTKFEPRSSFGSQGSVVFIFF